MSAWNPKKQGERRGFQRLPGEYRVRFIQDSEWIEVATRDLSQGGMLIDRHPTARSYVRARFELHLIEGEPPVGVDGIVRCIDAAGVHIEFHRGRQQVAKKIRQIIEASIIPQLEKSLDYGAAGRDAVIELAGWYNDVGRLSGAIRLYRAVQEQGYTGIELFEHMAEWLLSAAQRAEDPRPVLVELDHILGDAKKVGASDILDAVRSEAREMQDALATNPPAKSATAMASNSQAAGPRPVRGPIDLVMTAPVVEKRRTEVWAPPVDMTIRQLWLQLWNRIWATTTSWIRGNPAKGAIGAGVVIAVSIVVSAWPGSNTPRQIAADMDQEIAPAVAGRRNAKSRPAASVDDELAEPALVGLSSAVEEELFEEWGPEPELLGSPPEDVLAARRARRRAIQERSASAPSGEGGSETLRNWGNGSGARAASETDAAAPATTPAPKADKVTASGADHYATGARYLKEQKPMLAISELEAALRSDPRHAEAHLGLALAYALLGRRTRAIEMYERFIQIAPDHRKAAKVRKLLAAQR